MQEFRGWTAGLEEEAPKVAEHHRRYHSSSALKKKTTRSVSEHLFLLVGGT